MSSRRRTFLTMGVVASAIAAIVAAASTASGAVRSPAAVKPVIGKPVTAPAHALPGKRFTVSFTVTRSDTRAPLTRGKMVCDPSIAGKVIRHAESFKAGKARLSFVVPANASGKVLRVKVMIKTGRQSATRVATFKVLRTPMPSLSIGDVSAAEGNTGTTTMSFPVTLSAAGTQVVTVRYATTDGSASFRDDYTPATGTVTFKPGVKTQTIKVAVVGDTAIEPDETFTVTLSKPSNAKIADGTATGTISNDDVAPRSGHYSGTTSQGRSIAFDVMPDLASLGTVVVSVDLTCSEIPATLPNEEFEFRAGIPVAPDWSFAINASGGDASESINGTFSGKLSPPGASGTLRIDLAVNDVEGVGTVHCSSGNVTWTAS